MGACLWNINQTKIEKSISNSLKYAAFTRCFLQVREFLTQVRTVNKEYYLRKIQNDGKTNSLPAHTSMSIRGFLVKTKSAWTTVCTAPKLRFHFPISKTEGTIWWQYQKVHFRSVSWIVRKTLRGTALKDTR